MKISSTHVGSFQRLEPTQGGVRSERTGKTFSLKAKAPSTSAAQPEMKTEATEAPMTVALRSVASDFKAGRIPSREEAVRKMVSTVLNDQYGSLMTKDRGFQKMEHTIADHISDDPMLSKRMENLLQRLA